MCKTTVIKFGKGAVLFTLNLLTRMFVFHFTTNDKETDLKITVKLHVNGKHYDRNGVSEHGEALAISAAFRC